MRASVWETMTLSKSTQNWASAARGSPSTQRHPLWLEIWKGTVKKREGGKREEISCSNNIETVRQKDIKKIKHGFVTYLLLPSSLMPPPPPHFLGIPSRNIETRPSTRELSVILSRPWIITQIWGGDYKALICDKYSSLISSYRLFKGVIKALFGNLWSSDRIWIWFLDTYWFKIERCWSDNKWLFRKPSWM